MLGKLKMAPLRKGGNIYGGVGPDGVFRTCKFDYHKDREPVATGTAKAIAASLRFHDVAEMRAYLDQKGWKKK